MIDLPLVAHLTIHWAYTNVGDDPDGKRFAKVREGLAKWLLRHGIVFAAAWCIERMSRGQADVVHCHLLFHLPVEYRAKRKLQVEAAIYRLIDRHGRGYWAEEVADLRIHDNPDGKYWPRGLETLPPQERASPIARHHLRQALRRHPEHRPGGQG